MEGDLNRITDYVQALSNDYIVDAVAQDRRVRGCTGSRRCHSWRVRSCLSCNWRVGGSICPCRGIARCGGSGRYVLIKRVTTGLYVRSLHCEVVLYSVITIRIVGYATHCYVVDNHLHVGINARKSKAGRRVEGYVVLITSLHAVNLDGRIS